MVLLRIYKRLSNQKELDNNNGNKQQNEKGAKVKNEKVVDVRGRKSYHRRTRIIAYPSKVIKLYGMYVYNTAVPRLATLLYIRARYHL